jgi:hypothetical protein
MQKVDLYQQPIEAVGDSHTPPLYVKVVTHPRTMEFVGGMPATATKTITYVLYDALPDELRARVKMAIEALSAQG